MDTGEIFVAYYSTDCGDVMVSTNALLALQLVYSTYCAFFQINIFDEKHTII
jgi:hypothetical protein